MVGEKSHLLEKIPLKQVKMNEQKSSFSKIPYKN
jgi:hypothetical protein